MPVTNQYGCGVGVTGIVHRAAHHLHRPSQAQGIGIGAQTPPLRADLVRVHLGLVDEVLEGLGGAAFCLAQRFFETPDKDLVRHDPQAQVYIRLLAGKPRLQPYRKKGNRHAGIKRGQALGYFGEAVRGLGERLGPFVGQFLELREEFCLAGIGRALGISPPFNDALADCRQIQIGVEFLIGKDPLDVGAGQRLARRQIRAATW